MKDSEILKKHYQRHEASAYGKFAFYPRNWQLVKLYTRLPKTKRILDIGCGSGVVGSFFKEQNYEVYGLEINSRSAMLARKKGLKVYIRNVQNKFPFSGNFFDEVFWGDNIEHLYSPDLVTKEISRVLRSRGRLVVSTVNYANIVWRLLYLLTGRIPVSEGGDRKQNIGSWSHIRLWDDQSLAEFMDGEGFRLIRTVGTNFFGIIPRFLYEGNPHLFSAVNIYEFQRKAK